MSAGPGTPTTAELLSALDDVTRAPRERGSLALVVARPAEGERKRLDAGRLDADQGLVGDSWAERPSSKMPEGGPNPDAQLTVMGVRAVRLLSASEDPDRWALAGDQLFVDLDLSIENLPPGSRLAIADAVIEVTPEPHLGCGKFSRRFGLDALKAVNSDRGRELRLRGLNARVVEGGIVGPGDPITRSA